MKFSEKEKMTVKMMLSLTMAPKLMEMKPKTRILLRHSSTAMYLKSSVSLACTSRKCPDLVATWQCLWSTIAVCSMKRLKRPLRITRTSPRRKKSKLSLKLSKRSVKLSRKLPNRNQASPLMKRIQSNGKKSTLRHSRPSKKSMSCVWTLLDKIVSSQMTRRDSL